MKNINILFLALCLLVGNSALAEPDLTCASADGRIVIETSPKIDDASESTDLALVSIDKKPAFGFNVHPITLKNQLLYINSVDFGSPRKSFQLQLGEINSTNQYSKARLDITFSSVLGPDYRQHTPTPISADLDCKISPTLKFTNLCPEKNKTFFNVMLLNAAQFRNQDKIEQALACGAAIDTVNAFGCSAMMLAVGTYEHDCVAPETPSPENDGLRTYKAREIVKFLLKNGASASIQDQLGESLGHKIVKNGFPELVFLLEKDKGDLDLQELNDMTPLMYAATADYWVAVESFVIAGADILKRNLRGKTAYDLGVKLPAYIRKLLNPALSDGTVIQGQIDGCTPLAFNLPMGQLSKITLKSTSNNMFLMTSKDLGINLMSAPAGSAAQTVKIDRMGTFEFQCGIHGQKPVVGKITITM
jgi:hypothetical protein